MATSAPRGVLAGPAHEPVMAERVTELLALPTGAPAVLIDATVGAGGHAAMLLAASHPDVHLVAFDRDRDALALAGRRLVAYRDRVTLVHGRFDTLAEHVEPVRGRVGPVLGILYDLGVSSMQLDTGERGFSFRADAPLDMRMDPTAGRTAADLVNTLDERDLVALIRRLGEEPSAVRISRAVVAARPLRSTRQLADLVVGAVPAAVRRQPTHPATRTFQALRIAVNDELDALSASLPQALTLAAPAGRPPAGAAGVPPAQSGAAGGGGGRIVVLAYHSLEDRIAKRAFAEAATGCICPPDLPVCGCGRVPQVTALTRGVERPDPAEVEQNPRARSARLRAVARTDAPPIPQRQAP